MDYRLFENLGSDEARAYLDGFLRTGRDRLPQEDWQRLRREGVEAVPAFFKETAAKLTLVQVPPPEDLEPWIVEAMERDHGGFPDREDVAEAGQPVVTGFRSGADLPVLQVAENLLLDRERDVAEVARTAIETWRRVV